MKKAAIAPIITAKGEGFLAEKIIKEAEKNDLPIKEDYNVINLLDNQKAGSQIPEVAWEAVALIFSYILKRDIHHGEYLEYY